jgi:hypothetical protein
MKSTSMHLKSLGNVALLAGLWVTSLIVLGVAFRMARTLFCIGYGC